MSTPAAPYTLYRFFDAAGDLIYIGVTARGPIRFAEHDQKEWWSRTARIDVEHLGVMTRTLAMRVEAEAVAAERPPYNADLSEVGKRAWDRRRSAELARRSANLMKAGAR